MVGKTRTNIANDCDNPNCRQSIQAKSASFHNLGNESCSFYSAEERFCCSSCATERLGNFFTVLHIPFKL